MEFTVHFFQEKNFQFFSWSRERSRVKKEKSEAFFFLHSGTFAGKRGEKNDLVSQLRF
jgi:hypothetical protein